MHNKHERFYQDSPQCFFIPSNTNENIMKSVYGSSSGCRSILRPKSSRLDPVSIGGLFKVQDFEESLGLPEHLLEQNAVL
jgi:hypothetical protein